MDFANKQNASEEDWRCSCVQPTRPRCGGINAASTHQVHWVCRVFRSGYSLKKIPRWWWWWWSAAYNTLYAGVGDGELQIRKYFLAGLYVSVSRFIASLPVSTDAVNRNIINTVCDVFAFLLVGRAKQSEARRDCGASMCLHSSVIYFAVFIFVGRHSAAQPSPSGLFACPIHFYCSMFTHYNVFLFLISVFSFVLSVWFWRMCYARVRTMYK